MQNLTRWLALATLLLIAATSQAGSPKLTRISPPGGQRGTTVEAFLYGKYLDLPRQLLFYESGIKLEFGEALSGEVEINGRKEKVEAGSRCRLRLKIADDCPLGPHGLRLRTAHGLTEYLRFSVSPFPTVEEKEELRNGKRNDARENAEEIPLNSTIAGKMTEANDVDMYRIELKKGQRISAEIECARLGSERNIPDLFLAVQSSQGKKILEADDSALFVQDPIVSFIAKENGTHYVQVRHNMYAANGEVYRLHIGEFSRPTGFYPGGGKVGEQLNVRVLGDPKGEWKTTIPLPAEPQDEFVWSVIDPQTRVPAPSPNKLRVSPFANVLETEPNNTPDKAAAPVDLPIAFNGIIEKAGDVDCFRFRAKKGERYKFYAVANVIGSPLDPTIWVEQVDAKKNKPPVQKASDSRPNQLGMPPTIGNMRETLDPVLEFNTPADGEYVIGIESDRGDGGPDYVYRIECTRETDGIYTYIPQEPENQQAPQLRQAIAVPSGNRYNTQIAVFTSNRPHNGDLELFATGLPEGVTMSAPRLAPGVTRVPVVFSAAPGMKVTGASIDVLVRPVDAEKEKPPLPSGFRQTIPLNLNNNDAYLLAPVQKVMLAVYDAVPFRIEVEEPNTALVQNGEMNLQFKVLRDSGFKDPVTVSMEWKPNGVNASTPITVPGDGNKGQYQISASKQATAGTYQVTLTAVASGSKNDGGNKTYICAQPFKLIVAEPHLEGKFARTSIERGKTVDLNCKITHLKPFPGKAKATLSRLPRGIELVTATRDITKDTKEVNFTIRATEDCLLGNYQGIVLDLTVTEGGQSTREFSGYGMLRVDAERATRVTAK